MSRGLDLFEQLKSDLRTVANPERAAFAPHFFKAGSGEYAEGDQFLGVSVPNQRKLAKKYYKRLTIAETLRLLQSPWHEERLTALFILVLKYQKGEPQTRINIFDLYMDNTAYVNNWDLVDSSAGYIVGNWLQDSPYRIKVLTKLANSQNLWERRIAMIATFYFIKEKASADEALIVAEILLHDPHDLIQKAVGWMLREIGKRVDRALLLTFLDQHAHDMPRTTLRYALEHLSTPTRQYYMKLKNTK